MKSWKVIPIARTFLRIYVAIGIFIIFLGLIATISSGEAHLDLVGTNFFLACGMLAIVEALEVKK